MTLDEVTVFVGPNGTGKSTVLRALRWFFEGGVLSLEDHAGQDAHLPVSVGVTFDNLSAADMAALGPFVHNGRAEYWRRSNGGAETLTGSSSEYTGFRNVRAQSGAIERRKAYASLVAAHSELGLPKAASVAAVDQALDAWEANNPDKLVEAQKDASSVFRTSGGVGFSGRFDFVFVPAVSDPEDEIRDSRGTLLRQLLDRALGEQSAMREKLADLEEKVSDEMRTIVESEAADALDKLSRGVSGELARLIPGARVALQSRPPSFRVPDFGVDVRVADGDLMTDVGHQGHGFQRALAIAVLQQLAAARSATFVEEVVTQSADIPTLFLAMEEPELYQHPQQARHFARSLAELPGGTGPGLQVAYATHSEHFVDPSRYQQLRRFQRRRGTTVPETAITQATVDRVAGRLTGAFARDQVEIRVRITLRRQLSEAVFANGALIVEGDSDAGLFHGLADRDGGFDALGIAVVSGHNKRQLLIPWAILTELGVPTYVVFDGDGGLAERLTRKGRRKEDAQRVQREAQAENEVVLHALGATPERAPATTIGANYTVFEDAIEAEAEAWLGFSDEVAAVREELGDWRKKSDDAYRLAASRLSSPPPPSFVQLMERIRALR